MTPTTFLVSLVDVWNPTSSAIVLLPKLIPHLTPTLSSSELPAFLVAWIDITPNHPFVQLRAGNIPERGDSLGMQVILDKGETTWSSEVLAELTYSMHTSDSCQAP